METITTNGTTAAMVNSEKVQGSEILNIKTDGRVRTEQDKETGLPRYAFAYVLCVGGKYHSIVNLEQWNTWDGMQSMKWGIWDGASMFRKTVSVLVYVLCKDGYYRLCCSANHNGEILPPFHKDSARRGTDRPTQESASPTLLQGMGKITAEERKAHTNHYAAFIRKCALLVTTASVSNGEARIEVRIAYCNGSNDPDDMSYKVCWYDLADGLKLKECGNGVTLEQAARAMADFRLLSEAGLTINEILQSSTKISA